MLNINSQFYQCDLNTLVLLCFSLKTLKRMALIKKKSWNCFLLRKQLQENLPWLLIFEKLWMKNTFRFQGLKSRYLTRLQLPFMNSFLFPAFIHILFVICTLNKNNVLWAIEVKWIGREKGQFTFPVECTIYCTM